jgi:hypothetical protein
MKLKVIINFMSDRAGQRAWTSGPTSRTNRARAARVSNAARPAMKRRVAAEACRFARRCARTLDSQKSAFSADRFCSVP